jgi:hypothetical protein
MNLYMVQDIYAPCSYWYKRLSKQFHSPWYDSRDEDQPMNVKASFFPSPGSKEKHSTHW